MNWVLDKDRIDGQRNLELDDVWIIKSFGMRDLGHLELQ